MNFGDEVAMSHASEGYFYSNSHSNFVMWCKPGDRVTVFCLSTTVTDPLCTMTNKEHKTFFLGSNHLATIPYQYYTVQCFLTLLML